jgi:hypothetical protein
MRESLEQPHGRRREGQSRRPPFFRCLPVTNAIEHSRALNCETVARTNSPARARQGGSFEQVAHALTHSPCSLQQRPALREGEVEFPSFWRFFTYARQPSWTV